MSKTHMIDERKTHSAYNSVWTVCGLGGIPRWMAINSKGIITCKNCLRVMRKNERDNENTLS